MVTKQRLDIQSKKFIFIIIWNPSGFYVVDGLPNDTKMNNTYFVTNQFIPVEEATFARGRASRQKRLVVRHDNCSVHTSRASKDWLEEHSIRRMPHPRYRLIRPQWLLLVSYSERKIRMDSGGWRGQVFECLQEILRSIDQEELNGVFQAWTWWVQEVSQGNGDYVRW
jgi:hypothetical protein